MTWHTTGKRPTGPYVAGSTEGRIRELEDQVELLTNLVDQLMSVVRIEGGGRRVKIVAAQSLTLESTPSTIELSSLSVNAANGRRKRNLVD